MDRHERRMKRILMCCPPDEIKGKKLLSALAGGAVDPDVSTLWTALSYFSLPIASVTALNRTTLPPPSSG
jgi:hypothetical protein